MTTKAGLLKFELLAKPGLCAPVSSTVQVRHQEKVISSSPKTEYFNNMGKPTILQVIDEDPSLTLADTELDKNDNGAASERSEAFSYTKVSNTNGVANSTSGLPEQDAKQNPETSDSSLTEKKQNETESCNVNAKENHNDTEPDHCMAGKKETEAESVKAEKNPADAKKTPADAEKTPADAVKNPTDTEKNPFDAEENPADAEKTPPDAEENPPDADTLFLQGEGDSWKTKSDSSEMEKSSDKVETDKADLLNAEQSPRNVESDNADEKYSEAANNRTDHLQPEENRDNSKADSIKAEEVHQTGEVDSDSPAAEKQALTPTDHRKESQDQTDIPTTDSDIVKTPPGISNEDFDVSTTWIQILLHTMDEASEAVLDQLLTIQQCLHCVTLSELGPKPALDGQEVLDKLTQLHSGFLKISPLAEQIKNKLSGVLSIVTEDLYEIETEFQPSEERADQETLVPENKHE